MGGISTDTTTFPHRPPAAIFAAHVTNAKRARSTSSQRPSKSLNSRILPASKIVPMKNKLAAAALAILFVSTGATALAQQRCRDDYGYSGYSRYRDVEVVRYAEPQVYSDRYGNRTIVTREQRYAVPVVVPQCRPAQVYEPRYESRSHREPHLVGALRFIFGR